MSPDWFDPLGLRGSRLDPFTLFGNALRGEGLAQQSAEALAKTMAQRLVGRRVEIDRAPPIAATVDRVDEVTPATALAALPTRIGEVPMWRLVRGRLRDVSVGSRRLDAIELTVVGVRIVGASAQRLRLGRVDFNATVSPDEVTRWAADVDGNHVVRVHEGRLEATHRRMERWAWVEVRVTAAAQTVVVTPIAVRLLGRSLPLPRRLGRPVLRPAPWLPAELVVDEVRVTDVVVGVRGGLDDVLVPVDVTRVLEDLGSERGRSALRIVMGDR